MSAASQPATQRAARWLLQASGAALLAYLIWQALQWGVLNAIWQPDAEACRAVGHAGACWGVVAEKGMTMVWGHPGDEHLTGLPLTLVLFAASWALSWPIGLALALSRQHGPMWLKASAVTIIELIRGVPLITLLFAAAFIWPLLTPEHWQIPLVWRAGIALTLFSSVYLAEILRGGLQTIPKEQSEAGATLGLSWLRIQRVIVLPQAIRSVLPTLTGHAIGLLKDSSLVMVIGLHELTGSLSLSLGGDPEWRPFYFEAYLFVGLIYALMCFALSYLGRSLERRFLIPAT